MYQSRSIILTLCLVALCSKFLLVESQVFDKILNTGNNNNKDAEVISNNGKDLAGQQPAQVVDRVRNMFQDMMTVNVP